ncbi:MAG: diacylglycerol kinase family protein [Bacteroidota bacterium]
MKTISFILHGKLKRKDQLKHQINQRLSEQYKINFCETSGSGDAIHLARNIIKDRADYLISVGGDGTINEVVNGYMNSDESLRDNVTVGILPYGTGNDFSRTIGMRKDIEQLAEQIENDRIKPVDIGEVQYRSFAGETRTRYYINITDLGIGGLVVKTVNKSSKILGPYLTYNKAIIQSFLTFKHKKIRLTSDSFQWEGPILCLCMANGRYFGSGICIAPQADVSNGKIQIVIFGNMSLIDYIKNISRIRKGEILEHPEVRYEQVRSCRIEPLDPSPALPEGEGVPARRLSTSLREGAGGWAECPVDMDGEFIGYAPVELKIHEHAVKFLMD